MNQTTTSSNLIHKMGNVVSHSFNTYRGVSPCGLNQAATEMRFGFEVTMYVMNK
jgi:coenzyme PQQ precursor peptide PqqA